MTELLEKLKRLSPDQLAWLQEKHPREYAALTWHWIRDYGRENYWFFVKYILRNPVLYEPLHRPIANWLQDWRKLKKLLLIPRGHVKSNLATIGYGLWRIVCDPTIRILLVSHKEPDAVKFLNGIKHHIESQRFQSIYPEIRKSIAANNKPDRWSDKALLVERDSDLTENTVENCSLTSKVTGRHYDLLMPDDLVNENAVANANAIAATQEMHEMCQPLLDPGGLELMIGTTYDFDDEYQRVINTPDLAADYEIISKGVVQDALLDHPMTEWTDQDLIYPTRFTLAKYDWKSPDGDKTKDKTSLPQKLRAMGMWRFNCQYCNRPLDPSSATFRREDIQWVDALPENEKLTWFRVCDLSSETATRDSFTVIVTGAVDGRANIYITDVFRKQCSGMVVVEELIRGQNVPEPLRPRKVGFEPGPYERSLKPWLEKAMGRARTFIPIVFLPPDQAQKSKDERIRGLQPFVETRKFFIVRNCRNGNVLFDELLKHPAAQFHKDVADACAQIPHLMFPTGVKDLAENQLTDAQRLAKWFMSEFGLTGFPRIDPGLVIGNDRVTTRIEQVIPL